MATSKKNTSLKSMTPLWLIAGFLSLTEVIAGIDATQTTGGAQTVLVLFVCCFPVLVAGAFFYILWHKPYVLYPPGDFGSLQNVGEYVQAMRGLEDKTEIKSTAKIEESNSSNEANNIRDHQPSLLTEASSKHDSSSAPLTPDPPVLEFLIATIDADLDTCKTAFKRIRQRQMSPSESLDLEVTFAYWIFSRHGDSYGLSELENLTSKNESKIQAWLHIGYAWRYLKDYSKAKSAFTFALQFSSESKDRVESIVGLVDVLTKDGQYESAIEAVVSRLPEFNTNTDLSALYKALGDVYGAKDDLFFKALCLEKALSHTPTNESIRFDAGWAYSEKSMHHMGLLHYDTLTTFQKVSPGGFNNLGVECSRLQMPITAVRQYRESLKQKNSLAGSNLAQLYLSAGFADEAKNLLGELRLNPDAHANVGSTWSNLAQAEEDEKNKMKNALKKGRSLQKVLQQFADAYFTTPTEESLFSGTWMLSEDVQITIRENEGQLFSEWIEGDYIMKMTGQIHGKGARIHLKKEVKNNSFITLLNLEIFEIDGFACLSVGNNKLSVFNFDKDDPSILTFTRVLTLSKQGE